MSRWFRFYAAAIRHPKVAKLSDKDFRLWLELMSVAAENDGAIPPLEDLKHLLKRRLDHLSSAVDRLISGGLIDRLGDGYEPHDWSERQYKSDTSTERVRKHREKRNVSETPPDTETDTEVSLSNDNDAGASDSKKAFWANAISYLGGNKRSMVGKWVKDHGHVATGQAITAAQIEGAVDPVAYINRVLRKPSKSEVIIPP